MTMVEVIAIIATGVLCVLCVICIVAAINSRSQARENSQAIKDIEESLSSFGDSIQQKTDQLIDHMDRQRPDDLQAQRLEYLEQEVLRLSKLEEEAAAISASVPDAADGAEESYEPEEIEEIEELDDEIELDDLFRELAAMETAEQEETPLSQEPQMQAPAPEPEPVPAPQPESKQQFVQPVPAPAPQPVQPIPAQQPVQPAQPQPQPVPAQSAPAQKTRYHQGYNIGRSGKKYTAEELNMLIRE